VEGQATAGGLQGCPADALLDILQHHSIQDVFKWVDDIHYLLSLPLYRSHDIPIHILDLSSFSVLLNLLAFHGTHERKGQEFAFTVHTWFPWDMEHQRVFFT